MLNSYEELLSYISGLEIIDTHEHLPAFERTRNRDTDVLGEYLSHYYNRDLVSAGMPESELSRLADPCIDIMEKWNAVEPYWKICCHTGYGQSLEIAARDIYGIDRVDGSTIQELDGRFRQGHMEQHFRKVLKDMCKIKVSILDIELDSIDFESEGPDAEYYVKTNRIDRLVYPRTHADILVLEKLYGKRIAAFDDYLGACAAAIESFASQSRILKCALAYERDLNFERTPYHEAEEAFLSLFEPSYYCTIALPKDRPLHAGSSFQNYVMHYLLSIAQEKEMVLQIHTGIQEGNGNLLCNSKPTLLNNLFMDYPGLQFDVFHIGYPYQSELGVFAKWYPNVWVDMCWAHIVSPVAARQTLDEWLEVVPYNKILGFGGDYLFVDGVYGHLCLARKNIALTLSGRVDSGFIDIEEAKLIARSILYLNPAKVYGIV